MTQGERVRAVRNHFELTLEKFGNNIGMKKNSVSQLENGKNSLTEQTLKSICREFNVNETWLRTGNGEMFNEMDSMDVAFNHFGHIMGNASNQKKAVLAALVEMMYYVPDDKWDFIYKQFENCLDEARKEPEEG